MTFQVTKKKNLQISLLTACYKNCKEPGPLNKEILHLVIYKVSSMTDSLAVHKVATDLTKTYYKSCEDDKDISIHEKDNYYSH